MNHKRWMVPKLDLAPFNYETSSLVYTHTSGEVSAGRVHAMPFWFQGKFEFSRLTTFLAAAGLAEEVLDIKAAFGLYRIPNWRQGTRGVGLAQDGDGATVRPYLEFELIENLGVAVFDASTFNGSTYDGDYEYSFDILPSRWLSTENCPYAIGWQVSSAEVGFRHSNPITEASPEVAYRTNHEAVSFGTFPRRLVAYGSAAARPFVRLRSPWGVRLFPTKSEVNT